jgi:pimeloyl-ACP methyl ester carboxylesterase
VPTRGDSWKDRGYGGQRTATSARVRVSRRRPHWLLLHGTPLDPGCWEAVADRLRVHGRVDLPEVTPRATDREPQRHLAAELAALHGDGPRDLDVVGHSFGGQVALELALALPHRIHTLTLLCSRDTPFPSFATTAARLRAGAPVEAEVDVALTRWFTAAELDADGSLVRYARTALRLADRGSWAAALDGIATFDVSGRVAGITAPTTLVAAEYDAVATPVAMADLQSRIPGATLVVLDGAAHLSPFVDADDLSRRILEAAARGVAVGVSNPPRA